MKTLLIITAIFFGAGNWLTAQVTTGTISGKVLEKDSITPMPFAKVYVEYQGTKINVMADADGRYKFDGLKPGSYNVGATFVGFGGIVYGNVPVTPEGITFLDVVMKNPNTLDVITIIYTPPLLDVNLPMVKIPLADIKHSLNVRNPLAMIAGSSSDVQVQEGSNQIIIRGSRPGDAVYYIDGVKMTNMNSVPVLL